MIQVNAATVIRAPREIVTDVYADYPNWPSLFPAISGVRLIRKEARKHVLEVDHAEGKVINEISFGDPHQIELWEVKRRYTARFLNQFSEIPGGTEFHMHGEISIKGPAALLEPFLRGFARRKMERLTLQPVKAEAEKRAGSA